MSKYLPGEHSKAQGTRHKAQGTRHKAQGTRHKAHPVSGTAVVIVTKATLSLHLGTCINRLVFSRA